MFKSKAYNESCASPPVSSPAILGGIDSAPALNLCAIWSDLECRILPSFCRSQHNCQWQYIWKVWTNNVNDRALNVPYLSKHSQPLARIGLVHPPATQPPHLFKCGGMSPVAARERAGILKRKHVQAVHSDSQGGCVTRASRSLPLVSLQEKGNKIAHVNSQVAKAHRA